MGFSYGKEKREKQCIESEKKKKLKNYRRKPNPKVEE